MEKEEGVGSVTFFDDSDHSDDHYNSIQEVTISTIIKSLSQNTNASKENNNASLSTDKMFYKKNNKRNAKKIEKIEQDDPISKRLKAESRASKPKLIHKESEYLTISSHEEEDSRTNKIESVNNNALLNNASNAFNEDANTILEKELVVTSTSVSHSCNDYLAINKESSTGICDNQSLLDNEQLSQVTIECQMVIIGSYKCIPKENVIISHTGVRFNVPLLEDATSFVTLDVKYKDICKLLVHFGISLPVLFFYTSPSSGAMIRELLGMKDPNGPYYDPIGKYDFMHRRITVLSNKLLDYSRPKLNSIFSPTNKIDELNSKEAHNIFVRASPRDNQQSHNTVTRKQNQSSVPNIVDGNDNIQAITIYPPPPAKGGIAINTEDYLCLAEDQFLNDVIIDFYLKYLILEILSESDQRRTHMFSSYFYKRLIRPHAQADESVVPMTPAAKRHARVQKWTKNVNIFEKDFIIIPINKYKHWFLAIICFPGLVGKVSTPAKKTIKNDVQKVVKKLKKLKTKAITIGSTITPVPTTITIDQLDDEFEKDEVEGDDDDEMEIDSDKEDETERPEENTIQTQIKLEQQKEIVKIPCILIFDSLAGTSRSRVIATLRDYLSCEYVSKFGAEKTFSKDTIKGAYPKVPQQSNLTDCGLYVLQYVESFFKDPIKDYTLPIKTLKTWFEEIIVTRKREELSKLLIRLINNTKGNKTISLPTINFPTSDGKLKPKSETQTDTKAAKPEGENKEKSTNVETETRIVSIVTENTEPSNEFISSRTYHITPCSLQVLPTNTTESNTTELNLTEHKTTKLISRRQDQDDSPTIKKHKGESFNSCK
ncbi:LOW QUALITY PROTEIN: uncharacterized protein LOC114941496 [Nylanderia fulva]|uniref:LOW QUALITY PROTEIN: uncharacterized protein LOC114941496 n=1 Tax=Nylanderia fulva TaxID=613905 RepID=UPI0010FBA223|nr:LOW QUALITY PROTEIN: uncharacterized protein LOC114941496 [Nylanderia fulva]